jgi:hypothetical protein
MVKFARWMGWVSYADRALWYGRKKLPNGERGLKPSTDRAADQEATVSIAF